jgi:hypothetical protein
MQHFGQTIVPEDLGNCKDIVKEIGCKDVEWISSA